MTSTFSDMTKIPSFKDMKPEAFVESGTIWMKGIQDISKLVAETSKSQLEDVMSTWKTLATVKSIEEMTELQKTFAKSFYETSVANTTRIIDEFKSLAERTMAPVKPSS